MLSILNRNPGKKETALCGFMEGKYVSGAGRAHKCCSPHTAVFKCKMYGTFNVRLTHGRIDDFSPTIVTEKKAYWFLSISKGQDIWFGWAIRDHNSRQLIKILEVLTKEKLPNTLKEDYLQINIYEKWNDKEIVNWSKDQYWFQTFPFSSKKRADSEFVWDTINKIDWSGLTVLDIGCHYGYHSFKASESGATVTGFEPNENSLKAARIIQRNILQQDINFVKEMPDPQRYDVIMYLSVHHQLDPQYVDLKKKITELKSLAIKHLFVELIIPPLFPKEVYMSENAIDQAVGGTVIARYKHNVRGYRKIYWIKK